MNRLFAFVERLSQEPPFRLVSKAIVKRLPVSSRTKSCWDVVSRPHYLTGVLAAADEAKRDGVKSISVFEFGVAGGNGLLALAEIAAAVESETGIKISVYGFDIGTGLPQLLDDYRDYPDRWKPGDFPMDEVALRKRLKRNTTLVIGNISETIPEYFPGIEDPIGFIAVDVDLYSSARDLLRLFTLPNRKMLKRTFMYFDDVDLMFTHRFAGELLAIDEFNASSNKVKIDRWRGIEKHRPFPESAWLKRMYIAHDLEAISKARIDRSVGVISLEQSTGSTG
jgi:hypothetical protein